MGGVGRPGGIYAVHAADDLIAGEPVGNRHVIGHPVGAQIGKDGELGLRLGGQVAPEQRLAGLLEPVEGAALPPAQIVVASAVFGEGRFLLCARPAEGAAFVNRVKRVDEHERAGQRQTASHFALTKTGKDC